MKKEKRKKIKEKETGKRGSTYRAKHYSAAMISACSDLFLTERVEGLCRLAVVDRPILEVGKRPDWALRGGRKRMATGRGWNRIRLVGAGRRFWRNRSGYSRPISVRGRG